MSVINIGTKKKGGRKEPSYYIIVDGVEDKHRWSICLTPKKNEKLHVRTYDLEVIARLRALSILELAEHFSYLALIYPIDWNPYVESIQVDFRTYAAKDKPRIDIQLQPDWEQWANPYSIAEYAGAIEGATREMRFRGAHYYNSDETISAGFGLRCNLTSGKVYLGSEIDRRLGQLKEIIENAETKLILGARKNSLTTLFTFPPPIKAACEQYLVYFVQFLDDLGVKASAEIKDEAHRVLFSVTPADGPSALLKVREALDVFLQLPGMPEIEAIALSNADIGLYQLRANVFHLKSQLMLAEATLATNRATIEALQLSNYQYRQIVTSVDAAKLEKEALIGESLHVTKVETTGLSLDLPLILRKIKRRLGWKKE